MDDPFYTTNHHGQAYGLLARALKRVDRVKEALDCALEGIKKYPENSHLRMAMDELVGKSS